MPVFSTIGSLGTRDFGNPQEWSAARIAGVTLADDEFGDLFDDSAFTGGQYLIGGAVTQGTAFTWGLRSTTGVLGQDSAWGAGVRFAPSGLNAGHVFVYGGAEGEDIGCTIGAPGRGFEVTVTGFGSSDECFRMTDALGVSWDSMHMRSLSQITDTDGIYWAVASDGATYNVSVVNCVFYNFGRAGIHPQFSSSRDQFFNLDLSNCIFDNVEAPIQYRARTATTTFVLNGYNNATGRINGDGGNSSEYDIINSSSLSGSLHWTLTGDNNMTRRPDFVVSLTDNPWPDAGNSLASVDITAVDPGAAGNWIVATDLADPADLRPQVIANNDQMEAGVGTTNTNVPRDDIENRGRPVLTCDIGPYEETPASGIVTGAVDILHETLLSWDGERGALGATLIESAQTLFAIGERGAVGFLDVLHETLLIPDGETPLVGTMTIDHATVISPIIGVRGITGTVDILHETFLVFDGLIVGGIIVGQVRMNHETLLGWDAERGALGAVTIDHETLISLDGVRGAVGALDILHESFLTFDGLTLGTIVTGAFDVSHETLLGFDGERGVQGAVDVLHESLLTFAAIGIVTGSMSVLHATSLAFGAFIPLGAAPLVTLRVELDSSEPLRVELSATEPLRVELQ